MTSVLSNVWSDAMSLDGEVIVSVTYSANVGPVIGDSLHMHMTMGAT